MTMRQPVIIVAREESLAQLHYINLTFSPTKEQWLPLTGMHS